MKLSKIFFISLFILIPSTYADDLFENCESVFLQGKSISYFIGLEKQNIGEGEESGYLKKLKSLRQDRDCNELLNYARLGDNGLLLERTPLASTILETFDSFHQKWLTPEDLDRGPQCSDLFNNDFYDPKGPAYHLTKAFFQENRKASMAITAYGDLRQVTKGENPKVSPQTGMSTQQYKDTLKLDNDLQLYGNSSIIGYVYQRRLNMKRPYLPAQAQINNSWKDELSQNSFRVLGHLGAGLLGNSRFLIHYAHPSAYSDKLIQFDGKKRLPRRLAKAIVENLLCTELKNNKLEHSTIPSTWVHPLNQEEKCLSCHKVLDPLAAGLRHLTYVKSSKNCDQQRIQLLIPRTFQSRGNLEIWQEDSPEAFHLSNPVGRINKERFVGINQLGKLISNDRRFYRCHTQKYLELINRKLPTKAIEEITTQYIDHQNGLTLMKQILKALEKTNEK